MCLEDQTWTRRNRCSLPHSFLYTYFSQVPLLYSTMLRKLYLKGPNNPSQAGLDSPSRDSIAIADAFSGLKVEGQRTRSQSRSSRRSSKDKDCLIMWYCGLLGNTRLLYLNLVFCHPNKVCYFWWVGFDITVLQLNYSLNMASPGALDSYWMIVL